MSTTLDTVTLDRLGPSLYTAKLVELLGSMDLPRGQACEIGVGSGVCLLKLAQLGYRNLCGTDMNAQSLDVARQLLAQYSPEVQVELLQGDLWQVFDCPRSFAVVVANLPHFPGETVVSGRPAHWQGGNGRNMIDRFLEGLVTHLAPQGVAVITHHDLVGLEHTQRLARELALDIQEIDRWTVYESRARMESVNPKCLIDQCETLNQLGPYSFVDSRVLAIRKKGNSSQ